MALYPTPILWIDNKILSLPCFFFFIWSHLDPKLAHFPIILVQPRQDPPTCSLAEFKTSLGHWVPPVERKNR